MIAELSVPEGCVAVVLGGLQKNPNSDESEVILSRTSVLGPMGGIGVIALTGIVLNNNIVLIDTFNDLKKRGLELMEAVLYAAAQRMRPVLLTLVTTVLGLLLMMFAVNIDLLNQDIVIGVPSSQWWTQLSSAIAEGLAFATLLTLVLGPVPS